MAVLTSLHVRILTIRFSKISSTQALSPPAVIVFWVLACFSQLVACTTLVVKCASVQYVRGVGSFPCRALGPLMDTYHLLEWPELDLPVHADDAARAGDAKRFGGCPVDSVLRTARRHTQ